PSKKTSSLNCLTQALPPPPSANPNDGSASSPMGAPQAAALLGGYAVRPGWLVAGVDSAVGVPVGSVLKDPTLVSMPGVQIDSVNKELLINADNITLDGYDFTLHGGWSVDTRTSKNFVLKNSNVVYVAMGDGAIQNCVFDGTFPNSNNW